jgi:hypothetical protein
MGIVLAVGTIACLAACGAAPTTSAPPGIAWERIDPLPDSRDGPSRVMDAGRFMIGTGTGGPWASEDGRTWTPCVVDGPDGATVAAVAPGPGGGAAFVAVGSVGGMGSNLPAAFASADGRRWSAVEGQPAFDPLPGYEQAQLSYVASAEAVSVAAGTEWGTAGQRPFVLVSSDGRRWERVGEPLAGSGPRALVATDAGFVMAGAANAPAGQITHAAFWTSPDGRSWEAGMDIPAFANAEPQALAVGHDTIVAVGFRAVVFGEGASGGGLAPAVWVSSDGRSWVAAAETAGLGWWPAGRPTPAPGALSGTMMGAVASLPDGFVAVGARWGINPAAASPPDGQARITTQGISWRSVDGRTWEMDPDDPALPLGTCAATICTGLSGVLAWGDQVVAVGGTEPDGVVVFIGTQSTSPGQ